VQLGPRVGFIRDAKGAAMLFDPLAPHKWGDPAAKKEATAKLGRLFKADTIDWSKQMVLLVEAGRRDTEGYRVEVTGLDVKDGVLVVKWQVHEPKPGAPAARKDTYPAVALLVERFDGEVTFDPAVK
jgi:hypothetical protein